MRPLARRLLGTIAAALGRRGFEAGGAGKRWPGQPMRTPNRDALAARATAGARAAWIVANSPYGASLLNALTTNLVADGPSMRPASQDARLRKQLSAMWTAWWSECDAERLSDLGGFLARLARSLVIYGESFVHLEADAATGGLRLRLWAPEQVDASVTRELGGGARIVAGIELDAAGRRIAYHVRENPDMPLATPWGTRRVAAEDVLHIFDPIFPGQVRGISWLAPVLTRLAEVDKLEDALLAKFNVSALFGGVFYNAEGSTETVLPGQTKGGVQESSLEPGAMVFAPPGYQVEFSDPPSAEGATEFLRAQIRSIAAGAGLPYELVSHDLSQVNYSSARLGLLEFRRRVTAVQKNILTARFLEPVWRRFLLLEALSGRLALSAALTFDAEFIFPGWAQIDPVKETKADVEAVNARFKSRFEVISGRGRDPEAVDAEIAQDRTPKRERTPA